MITLGLDIGVSSLGTAIVDTQNNQILHTGVYVFPAGKEAFGTNKEKPKNETRRVARQGRRQNYRRRLRRSQLLKFLYQLSELNSPEGDRYVPLTFEEIDAWLSWDKEGKTAARQFPDSDAFRAWMAMNPYEIRSRAVEGSITRAEFGRLLYHIIQRRGFQSSRKMKTDEGAMAKGSGAIIGYTQTKLELGEQTLGQYLYQISAKEGEPFTQREEKPRGRYTLRSMYVEEMERIWGQQSKRLGLEGLEIEGTPVKELLLGQISHDPESGELLYKSNDSVLFYQRPLRSQKHLINKCSLESRKMYDALKQRHYIQGPRAAAVSHPTSEFHRALQVLSNVRVEGRTLYDMGLFQTSLDFLCSKNSKTIKVADLKRHLSLVSKLNYDDDQSLPGCPTIASITDLFEKGTLSYHYGETDTIYIDIWQKLLFYDDERLLEKNIADYAERKGLKLKADFAKRLEGINLVDDYGSISIHAMDNIIPFLLQGRSHTEAIFLGGVKNAFGPRYYYFEKEEQMWQELLQIINEPASKGEKIDRLIEFLSNPDEQTGLDEKRLRMKLYHPTQSVQKIEIQNRLGMVDNLRNPIVEQALWAVRREVNALIDQMIEQTGNPNFRFDRITIELSRDLKSSLDRRLKIRQEQEANRAENEEAVIELRARGVRVTRDNILKYRLHKELRLKGDGVARCPYTGKDIGLAQLYDGNNLFQIEHIIPRSISLDNSFGNKTLCESNFNREKGNMTPYEFYSVNSSKTLWGAEDWDEITHRVRQVLPARKASRFLSKRSAQEQLEELPSKMLNDTAYMSVKAREYLTSICGDVRTVSGSITANLRRLWGLNKILGETYECLPGTVSKELTAGEEKEVYAILDTKSNVITRVVPKFNPIPYRTADEIRIPVVVKGTKLYRDGKEYPKPAHLDLNGVTGEALIAYHAVGGTPYCQPLFNPKPSTKDMLVVPATINSKNQLTSDYIEALRKVKKSQYPTDPGKYWVTLQLKGEPIWELPSNKKRATDNAVRVSGRLNGNAFWSPLFETEVDSGVVNMEEHRNRTAYLNLDYDTAEFTKMLRPAPEVGEGELLLTGVANHGSLLLDQCDGKTIDVQHLNLQEQTKYYVSLRYGETLSPEERVTIYPLYAKTPTPRGGEVLLEGKLFLLDKSQGLYALEPVKNRDDHRHHAVDALVIALAKQNYVTELSTYNRQDDSYRQGEALKPRFDLPWEGFREEAEQSINDILVVHKKNRVDPLSKVTRKITKKGKVYTSEGYAVRGALHKATIYGQRKAPGETEVGYHSRKSITEVTKMSQLNKVVDAAIRKEMLRILKEEFGLDIGNPKLVFPKNAFIDEEGKTKVYLPNRNGGESVPVKKVRLCDKFNNVVRLKEANQYVDPQNNHHVLIYEALDGSLQESVVTMWDVVDRRNRGEEIFQLPPDGKKVLFKLMRNQMYLIGITREDILHHLSDTAYLSKYLYRVQKLSSKDYFFRKATASTTNYDREMIRVQSLPFFEPDKDNIHSVVITLTGQVKLKDD
ncbi:type II CRISPR RNA-guided endonuclease Cas9 [uncultured Porphyromonas sp.]|uniref:type II CRISPR RNA-guided endonuclease Cas9 n=1 Tax=uncultured Porphyromonas sp. TaxID=159274 RepID=UPI00260ED38F|nr:type II CRISPR RNA-guided endonuclease Cas9 [uncultured Porphyromonas sp.]